MNGHGVSIIFRDLLLGLIGILVMVVFITLLQVTETKKKDDGVTPPGNVTALITWPEGDTDIDLWVWGPGEEKAVGYSNKGGKLWNLLRDDLGNYPDYANINMETSYSRGAPAGEYVINVHCFRCNVVPQTVQVEIGLAVADGTGNHVIGTATVTLQKTGQEKTALRFKLDTHGQLIPGSINAVYKQLRINKSVEVGR